MNTLEKKKMLNVIRYTAGLILLGLSALFVYFVIKIFNMDIMTMFLFPAIAMLCVLVLSLANFVNIINARRKMSLASFIYILGLFELFSIGFLIYSYLTEFCIFDLLNFVLLNGISLISYMILVGNFFIGVKLYKYSNNSDIIDISVNADAPDFDEELKMKKHISDLKRKVEMKTAQEEADLLTKILKDDE